MNINDNDNQTELPSHFCCSPINKMNINDDDDQTVGCAIARCADFLSNSDSDDISDNDYDSSLAETCYPVGQKSDCGGQGSVSLVNTTEKGFIYKSLQKHAIIYLFFLIS
jgi:hypothetical protein